VIQDLEEEVRAELIRFPVWNVEEQVPPRFSRLGLQLPMIQLVCQERFKWFYSCASRYHPVLHVWVTT